MRFGTFYFFQAAPGLSHAEVVHRELEQMEWAEELGFDEIWLTEHHFIEYGLAGDPGGLAAAGARRSRRAAPAGRRRRRGACAWGWPPPSCRFTIRSGWPSSSR